MIALGHLISAAFGEFKYAPPVLDLRGVSLVTAGGIALVAVGVDILAVRLRRPAVAGLPLLLLFSVPVASNLKSFDAIQILTFAAGLAGYLALLSADSRERLRMWGRLVTFRYVQSADETDVGPDTRDLAASGRRIGLAAICLAVLVPLILPAMHTRHVFGTTDDGSVGGTLVVDANPLGDTQRDLEGPPMPVLTYPPQRPSRMSSTCSNTSWTTRSSSDSWQPIGSSPLMPITGAKLPFAVPGNPSGALTTPVQTQIRWHQTCAARPYCRCRTRQCSCRSARPAGRRPTTR